MELSVSNIAWNLEEEEDVAARLRALGVFRVDIAPGKYLPDPAAATAAQIDAVSALWQARGFTIEGMQALLFGADGLNLFADRDGAMLERLAAVCRIGGALGARKLTFGSPRMRDRTGLDDAATARIATDFFRRLGDVAAQHGVVVCLEPNPAAYGCNFLVTTHEAAAMVRQVAHPAIRLQLDVGAIAMNGEPVDETVRAVAPLIGHIHASEPMLAPVGTGPSPHAAVGEALRALRPELVVTIEMARPAGRSPGDAVEHAVRTARRAYESQGTPRSEAVRHRNVASVEPRGAGYASVQSSKVIGKDAHS